MAPKSVKSSLLVAAILLSAPSFMFTPGLVGDAFGQQNRDKIEDAFDALDKKLSKAFEETDRNLESEYRKLDQAMQEAYDELSNRLRPLWGAETKLPERKVWTGYSGDLQTRVIVDYDKGVIAVETVREEVSVAALQEELQNNLDAGTRQLDDQDVLAKTIRKKIIEKKIKLPLAPLPPAPRLRPMLKAEIGTLADKTKKPVISERVIITKTGKKKIIRRIEIKMIPTRLAKSAQRFEDPVMYNADLRRIPRELVFSIMKNESAFNPRARSHVPAFGLMQLVPRSGGADALQFVSGKKGARPTPDFLYQPENNIRLGSAYLHIVYYRYLRSIKDPVSRLYCTISAYNTGAGNVAKAFIGSTNIRKASKRINAMTSEEVYQHLLVKLPYEETRHYLKKVRRDMKLFSPWHKADQG